MKLAIAYSTKDQVELTEQTFGAWRTSKGSTDYDFHWADGSTDPAALGFFGSYSYKVASATRDVKGGADAAIAWKLSTLLGSRKRYTHIGLLESDVLLDADWLEPTMALFEKGERDGLHVGAVSPRSYVDRVLVQRDGYAIMHNLGAGAVIFTRQAAEIVLASFRTHYWPDNVRLFAAVSGIDLRMYACFRGQEQFVTTDWGFEAQLARHGLAALALTPARCQMIGQVPSLKEQGLELVAQDHADMPRNDVAFKKYVGNLHLLRQGIYKIDEPGIIQRQGAGQLFFPHQINHLPGATWQGTWKLSWSQGFGPFSYRAGPGGASLSLRVSGSCCFQISGGAAGAGAILTDTRSGFKAEPPLPPEQGSFVEISVPGSPVAREIKMDLSEGAVFYGLQTVEAQMIDASYRFNWNDLPEAT